MTWLNMDQDIKWHFDYHDIILIKIVDQSFIVDI